MMNFGAHIIMGVLMYMLHCTLVVLHDELREHIIMSVLMYMSHCTLVVLNDELRAHIIVRTIFSKSTEKQPESWLVDSAMFSIVCLVILAGCFVVLEHHVQNCIFIWNSYFDLATTLLFYKVTVSCISYYFFNSSMGVMVQAAS